MEASPTHIQNNNHVALSRDRVAMHFDLTLSQYSTINSQLQFSGCWEDKTFWWT